MKVNVPTRSKNCERDYLSVRLSTCNTSTPTGRISVTFDI